MLAMPFDSSFNFDPFPKKEQVQLFERNTTYGGTLTNASLFLVPTGSSLVSKSINSIEDLLDKSLPFIAKMSSVDIDEELDDYVNNLVRSAHANNKLVKISKRTS
jgi:hypothetical protein